MSITTIVYCDALGCHQQYEDNDNDFQANLDLNEINWFWDEENDCHYCPNHEKAAREELGCDREPPLTVDI